MRIFTRKDILKATTIAEGILPKLQKLLSSQKYLISKEVRRGLDQFTRFVTSVPQKGLTEFFTFYKNSFGKIDKARLDSFERGSSQTFDKFGKMFTNYFKDSYEEIRFNLRVKKFISMYKDSPSRSEELLSKTIATTELFYLIEQLAWKKLAFSFNQIKLRFKSENSITMTMSLESSRSESTKAKGYALKNLIEKFEDRRKHSGIRALESSLSDNAIQGRMRSQDRCSEAVMFKIKYFVQIMVSFCKGKSSEAKRLGFTKLKELNESHNYEKKILQSLILNTEVELTNFRGCFVLISKYIKEVYRMSIGCNISLVDTISEKIFWFNEKAVPEFFIDVWNKKQLKALEKIIENKISRLSNVKSIFEINAGRGNKPSSILYITIDLSDSYLTSSDFEDPYLLIEVLCKGEPSLEISGESKNTLRALFLRSISNTKGNLNSLASIHREMNSRTKHKAFYKWNLFLKESKNQRIRGQTSRVVKTVEDQLLSLEEEMRKYQREIAEYDHNLNYVTRELEIKSEQYAELINKAEQSVLEKKAKTKCLSTSLMFCLFYHRNSQLLQKKSAFHKWKGLAGRAKITANVISKMAVVNRKHISARCQASLLIIDHIVNKYSLRLLGSSFKMLVASSVTLSPLRKSANLTSTHSRSSLLGAKDQKRSITPDRNITQGKFDNLKVPYLPLRSTNDKYDTKAASDKMERINPLNKSVLSVDLHNSIDQSMMSQYNLEKDFMNSQRITEEYTMRNSIIGTGNDKGVLENEFYSRSPKHRSYIQYKENLLEESNKKKKKQNVMSKKTKDFLRDFESNKYLKNRKGRDLNKSDIGEIGSRETGHEESGIMHQNFHFYKAVNNSFAGDNHFNKNMVFKNKDLLN